MAERLALEFQRCAKEGKIKEFSGAKGLFTKELKVAESDLSAAKKGFESEQWKWCTIQAYYSMFHTARALLYSKGYREKSHYCLRIAIEALFVSTGKLNEKFIDALQTAKQMRENADYEENFSEVGARKLVKLAEEFIVETKKIL